MEGWISEWGEVQNSLRDSSIKLLVKLQNLVLFADLACSSTLMMTALDVVETVMSPGQAQIVLSKSMALQYS